MVTILMIEDDIAFVKLVEKILPDHTIIHAGSALTGMQLAENSPINVILLDLDLPDLDGKVVATMLRARPQMQKIPIVAVSAQSDPSAQRMALAFGCTGFIAKPIDTRAFPAQVLAYCQSSNNPGSG
jgi:two-component system, cell cycle response regulator DivK